MTNSSNHPFSSSSAANSGALSNSPGRMALDNLIRRELKVSDPNDSKLVAEALFSRYKDTPRAAAIAREAQGVPFLMGSAMPTALPQGKTSSDAELQQAIDDVERDLQELTTNTILKDVTVELRGWAMAIRSSITEGVNAARFAIDPRQRDKAMGIRRTLGDYARIARLVGALSSSVNVNYRKLAQSLDEVAAVLLVMMGEALSSAGFSNGRFLMQVPYTELQVRRDAAIYALRNLVGATQNAYGPNDWPRGLDAYRRLFDLLEEQGQGDLRSLLVENELARIMDVLIQRAAHGSAEGLRALGVTAQLDLERFRRLVIVAQRIVRPESPPLTAFLSSLQLFADAFEASGGFRLLRIARPPVLFYGLYGTAVMDQAEHTLLQLIIQRGLLANQLDCFMQCGCSSNIVQCQIILDKILYDVDRSIDLYALGSSTFGNPERRAAAYSYVIESFLTFAAMQSQVPGAQPGPPNCDLNISPGTTGQTLGANLAAIQSQLRPGLPMSDPAIQAIISDLLEFGMVVRKQLLDSKLMLANDTLVMELQRDIVDNKRAAKKLSLKAVTVQIQDLTPLFGFIQKGQTILEQNQFDSAEMPTSIQSFLGLLQQELHIQKDMEERWFNLVQTMAPDCVPYANVFSVLATVLKNAIDRVSGAPFEQFDIKLPPHFETSLDSLAQDIDSDGAGRK
jgi:hypothetical protein